MAKTNSPSMNNSTTTATKLFNSVKMLKNINKSEKHTHVWKQTLFKGQKRKGGYCESLHTP